MYNVDFHSVLLRFVDAAALEGKSKGKERDRGRRGGEGSERDCLHTFAQLSLGIFHQCEIRQVCGRVSILGTQWTTHKGFISSSPHLSQAQLIPLSSVSLCPCPITTPHGQKHVLFSALHCGGAWAGKGDKNVPHQQCLCAVAYHCREYITLPLCYMAVNQTLQVKTIKTRCIPIHWGYTCKPFIYIIIASCLIWLFHYCQWEGHFKMIYWHAFENSRYIYVSMIWALHTAHVHRSSWAALTPSRESITHSAAYFSGIKGSHTFVFAGACTKNVPVSKYPSLIRQKNKFRFAFPSETFDTLRSEIPWKVHEQIELSGDKSDKIYAVSPNWKKWQKKMDYHFLRVFCWGEFTWKRQDLMWNRLFLLFNHLIYFNSCKMLEESVFLFFSNE